MPYVFTPPEQVQIVTLYQQGQASSLPGAFTPMYTFINNVLTTGSPPPATDPETKKSQLWMSGAVQANSGIGPYAVVIREYTQSEQRLHLGRPAPGGLGTGGLQLASNLVAARVKEDIETGGGGARPLWSLPTVAIIGNTDAQAVGQTLFQILGDSASPPRNAAWAGVVLHPLLGDDQSWRLIGASPSPTPSADTFDDYRNLFFAQT